MKSLYLLALLCIGLVSFETGCKTNLDPAGDYHGDAVLYNADSAITSAYDVLHTFVKWEDDNRGLLLDLPEVTKAADYVRDHARSWISTALTLREAYAKAPNAENKSALEASISILKAAVTEAAKYMASTKIK